MLHVSVLNSVAYKISTKALLSLTMELALVMSLHLKQTSTYL